MSGKGRRDRGRRKKQNKFQDRKVLERKHKEREAGLETRGGGSGEEGGEWEWERRSEVAEGVKGGRE